MKRKAIRVGIGGWTFAPWRGLFFPKGLAHAQELAFAAGTLTTIEVNGTFYRTQTRETFAHWAETVPDDFVLSLKAPRYATNRKLLAEAGPSIERFIASGVDALGAKLGPILWQLPKTKKFAEADMAAFIALLPGKIGNLQLRHVLEVRHASFDTPAFIALAKAAGVAICFADSEIHPRIDAPTADFTYARLQRSADDIETGYDADALDAWARQAGAWAKRGDVFVYFISGAKRRNPAAAMALIERL